MKILLKVVVIFNSIKVKCYNYWLGLTNSKKHYWIQPDYVELANSRGQSK